MLSVAVCVAVCCSVRCSVPSSVALANPRTSLMSVSYGTCRVLKGVVECCRVLQRSLSLALANTNPVDEFFVS